MNIITGMKAQQKELKRKKNTKYRCPITKESKVVSSGKFCKNKKYIWVALVAAATPGCETRRCGWLGSSFGHPGIFDVRRNLDAHS